MPENIAKLTFWGVRGSTPSMDRTTWRYGGNTPCLELVTPAEGRIILDCGTGMRLLGNNWAAADKSVKGLDADVLVTHYHWDHIQGIPFFAPLYSPQNKFRFYSFRSEFVGPDSLKRVFEAQMAHPYFPINLSSMSAQREFSELAGGDRFTVRDTRITARWLNHPQGCLGFRLETPAGTIVYATDNEPGIPEFDQALIELADGADIFINDAQYTPEQLGTRKGWGHSSWLAGVRTAKAAGVRNLVLFHHDPDSSDKAVDVILRDARGQFEHVWVAAEGMVLTLGGKCLDVAFAPERQNLDAEQGLLARVMGQTQDGQAFEEQTMLRGMGLRGGTIYLDHAPKLQSALQIVLEKPAGEGKKQLALQGYVVHVEPNAGKKQVGVGIVFTE
jgi:phosphoribosyl 1,2-cyclic phosphodiesterase